MDIISNNYTVKKSCQLINCSCIKDCLNHYENQSKNYILNIKKFNTCHNTKNFDECLTVFFTSHKFKCKVKNNNK